jgi:hypothetical protein
MTAEIVAFPRAITSATRNLVRKIVRREMKAAETPLTETAKNQRLRNQRREAWRRADAIAEYWLRHLRFLDGIAIAARHGLREAISQQTGNHDESRWPIIEKWREAQRALILTPASDMAAVNWKRNRLIGRNLSQLSSIGLSKERVEKVIADDLAFLNAHPTRQPRKVVGGKS